MKTITLTEEQEKFLNNLIEKMNTQDIRMTQYPLFYVQQEKEVWVSEDASYDYVKYIDEYGQVIGDGDDPYAEEVQGSDGEMCKVDRVCYVKKEYVTVVDVGPFLTEEAADLHIKQNHYHYSNPRTYVYSAWRNYELQRLLRLPFEILGKKVPSHYR